MWLLHHPPLRQEETNPDMSGLRTCARELNEQELTGMIHKAMAVLFGAAYLLFDRAIALAVYREIVRSTEQAHLAEPGPAELSQMQCELPRITAEVSLDWVTWAIETEGNWHWILQRCADLQQSYERRFGTEAPLTAEFRTLYRRSPRPRRPGRTPFPKEPC